MRNQYRLPRKHRKVNVYWRRGDIFPSIAGDGARGWQTRDGVTGCSKCVRNTRPRISSGRRFHRAIFPELPSIYRELCPSGN